MLYISTENIKYSTVGATFTVTFHTPIDEIGYLQAVHDKYAKMNMSAFPLTANTADTPQTDYDKGLQQLREIMFDKEKTEQLLKECEAMGIKPDCAWK